MPRSNYLSTKAIRELGQALTDDATFGIPRYATASLPTAATGNKGAVVYDTTTNSVKVSTGSAWVAVGGTGASALGNGSTVDVGTGTADATLGGVISTNVTSTAMSATAEEVLATHTIPANTLTTNGRGLRVYVSLSALNNGDNKTYRVRLGGLAGSIILARTVTTSSNNAGWVVLVRTNTTTASSISHSSTAATFNTTTIDLTGLDFTAQTTIVVTGETTSGTTAGNLTHVFSLVEAL